jgi:BASS family bile acid:Na+ symporter
MTLEPDGALLLQRALGREWFGLSLGTVGRWALLTIMFNMGLALQPADFRTLLRAPRCVAVGLVGQVLVLPLVAFVLVLIFKPEPYIAVGIVLLACCPGAATSNFFSYLARGDIALSVTLTALSGLIVLVTMPLLVNAGLWMATGAGQRVTLPVWQTMREILLLLVLPVGMAMLLRALVPSRLADTLQQALTRLSFAVLLLVVGLTFAGIWRELPGLLVRHGPYALALNAGSMLLAWWLAVAMHLGESQRRAIAVEVGVQNFLLAVVIATTVMRDASYVVFPLVYVFVMYVVSFAFVGWCRLVRDRKSAAGS